MKKRHFLRTAAAAAASALALTLAGCGGGGGGSEPAPTAQNGRVSVAVTDAPSREFNNVWITIREVAFHRLDSSHPEDRDWLRFPLPQPVTVDLAQLSNGNLAQVFSDLTLPVGEYRQIRLQLVDDDAPLAPSAQAAGLLYNDQVNYTDANGADRVAPLEMIGPRDGITVVGRFNVTTGKTLRLVLDFDIERDVLRFPDFMPGNAQTAFTLKPVLRYFDLDNSAAIVGRVDTSVLASSTNPDGAHSLIIKAEVLDASNTRRVVARATTIRPDGSFTLFPLLVPESASSLNYDIVVRGRNLETLIVRGVPAVKGTTPASNPTQVSSQALPLTVGTEYTVDAANALNPTGSWLNFFQTLPGAGELPYEVRFRHVNPLTGMIHVPFALSAGNVHVGDYAAGAAPSFGVVTPVQGTGGYSAVAGAFQYTRSSEIAVAPPAGGSNTSLAVPALAVDPAVAVPGAITFNVVTNTAGRYDRGYLIVARFGSIVHSQSLDAVLASNGGTLTMANLPAGTAEQPNRGAFYRAYMRVWNSASPLLRPRIIPVIGVADLRQSTSASLTAVLP